jgi:hypothetical protein
MPAGKSCRAATGAKAAENPAPDAGTRIAEPAADSLNRL